ncbi:hypothetical protein QCA50_011213 [Cerrena zonata]|uniref:Uncharacterized protein n=1 Tax=Cerrena zonata TaxID=2478898 RepID=A0AAW0FY54_9APHY
MKWGSVILQVSVSKSISPRALVYISRDLTPLALHPNTLSFHSYFSSTKCYTATSLFVATPCTLIRVHPAHTHPPSPPTSSTTAHNMGAQSSYTTTTAGTSKPSKPSKPSTTRPSKFLTGTHEQMIL